MTVQDRVQQRYCIPTKDRSNKEGTSIYPIGMSVDKFQNFPTNIWFYLNLARLKRHKKN